MEITYEQIAEANKTMTTTNIKGKEYVTVNQRVKAFRMLYPQGFIRTEILSERGDVCTMKASAGYYAEDGHEVILGTGMAYERESGSYINKTSYIENCETSAVGRALGFLGLGDASIASLEELTNALNNQQQDNGQGGQKGQQKPGKQNATVTKSDKVPPVGFNAGNAISEFCQKYLLTMEQFAAFRAELIRDGIVPDIAAKDLKETDAKILFAAIEGRMKGDAAE